jgi:formylglycine-generating enzyme required for sulfatase activity
VNDKGEHIYDCAGNVLEWCSGPGYRSGANYPLKAATLRGGLQEVTSSVDTELCAAARGTTSIGYTRAAYRSNDDPNSGYYDVGFRVAELLSDPEF